MLFNNMHTNLDSAQDKLSLAYSRNQNRNFLSSIIRRVDDIKDKSQ